MQVADVMHTDVKTADAEDTFADVAKTMRDGISSVVVLDGKLASIVTERDIVNLVAAGGDPHTVQVAGMTRRDLETIASDRPGRRGRAHGGPQHPAPPGRGSREGGRHRLDSRPHAMGGRGLASGSEMPDIARSRRPCRRRASCRSNGARRLTAQPSDAVRTRRSGRAAIPAPRRRAGRTATASNRAPPAPSGSPSAAAAGGTSASRTAGTRAGAPSTTATPRYLPSEHSDPSALKRKGSTARPSIVASTFVASRLPVASRTGPTAGRARRPRGRAPPPRRLPTPRPRAPRPASPRRPAAVRGRRPAAETTANGSGFTPAVHTSVSAGNVSPSLSRTTPPSTESRRAPRLDLDAPLLEPSRRPGPEIPADLGGSRPAPPPAPNVVRRPRSPACASTPTAPGPRALRAPPRPRSRRRRTRTSAPLAAWIARRALRRRLEPGEHVVAGRIAFAQGLESDALLGEAGSAGCGSASPA